MPGETAERAGGRGAENGRSFNQALYPVYALSPALMPRATSADASRRARAWKSRYVMRRSSWITATRSGWTAAVPGGAERQENRRFRGPITRESGTAEKGCSVTRAFVPSMLYGSDETG